MRIRSFMTTILLLMLLLIGFSMVSTVALPAVGESTFQNALFAKETPCVYPGQNTAAASRQAVVPVFAFSGLCLSGPAAIGMPAFSATSAQTTASSAPASATQPFPLDKLLIVILTLALIILLQRMLYHITKNEPSRTAQKAAQAAQPSKYTEDIHSVPMPDSYMATLRTGETEVLRPTIFPITSSPAGSGAQQTADAAKSNTAAPDAPPE